MQMNECQFANDTGLLHGNNPAWSRTGSPELHQGGKDIWNDNEPSKNEADGGKVWDER